MKSNSRIQFEFIKIQLKTVKQAINLWMFVYTKDPVIDLVGHDLVTFEDGSGTLLPKSDDFVMVMIVKSHEK